MSETATKSITISEASSQLGLAESEFRTLLKGIYKNPNTVKKISLDNFKMLAEAMKERAIAELEPEIKVDSIHENRIDNEIEPVDENTSITQLEQDLDEEKVTDLEESTDNTSLATTDSQALDIPQDKAVTQLNINLNLTRQVLDLNKIGSALAIIAGEQAVRNFEEIYTHTFNSGVDRVIQNLAGQTYNTIQQLREVDNADFLSQNGRETFTQDNQSAIDLVCQFL